MSNIVPIPTSAAIFFTIVTPAGAKANADKTKQYRVISYVTGYKGKVPTLTSLPYREAWSDQPDKVFASGKLEIIKGYGTDSKTIPNETTKPAPIDSVGFDMRFVIGEGSDDAAHPTGEVVGFLQLEQGTKAPQIMPVYRYDKSKGAVATIPGIGATHLMYIATPGPKIAD